MKEMTLTDSTTSKTWNHEYISSPFSENSNFGETDVTVLSGNVYTDYVYRKRIWTNIFGHLTADEFAELWGFVQRQYTTNRYPLLTLSDGSATNIPVKISISKKDVINLCGDVEGITLTMVETGQNLGQ